MKSVLHNLRSVLAALAMLGTLRTPHKNELESTQ
jgi:hypothetical protein